MSLEPFADILYDDTYKHNTVSQHRITNHKQDPSIFPPIGHFVTVLKLVFESPYIFHTINSDTIVAVTSWFLGVKISTNWNL